VWKTPLTRSLPIGERVVAVRYDAPRVERSAQRVEFIPEREEFEVKENEVVHKPTNATWTACPGESYYKTYYILVLS
jgi:hypothetical protein